MDKFYKESRISLFGGPAYSLSSSSSRSINGEGNSSFNSEDFESGLIGDEDGSQWVAKNEAYCFDLEKFTEKLINAIIVEANKRLSHKKNMPTAINIVEPLVHEILTSAMSVTSELPVSQSSSAQVQYGRSNNRLSEQSIDWPKISEFNIKLGLEKLEDYVSTWKRSKDWLFCIEFLGFESEDCSNIFVYEVEWSKPTNLYPIPQATASVYFALEVLKMVPYNYDRCIEVTYVFETSNVIHTPGRINFQEKWLEAIITAKEKAFKSLLFSVPKDICQAHSNVTDSEPMNWK